ncbi:hypothetical protein M6B38_405515 [Iris pallida]|uniref:Uncharacterized protein n=1 Tax=Iris pallida TaxID=29817 RepID=A0AAX6FRP3_IRIPA|nr:hypothetical protein M6B38_405515 [Iris pallida]
MEQSTTAMTTKSDNDIRRRDVLTTARQPTSVGDTCFDVPSSFVRRRWTALLPDGVRLRLGFSSPATLSVRSTRDPSGAYVEPIDQDDSCLSVFASFEPSIFRARLCIRLNSRVHILLFVYLTLGESPSSNSYSNFDLLCVCLIIIKLCCVVFVRRGCEFVFLLVGVRIVSRVL